MKFANVIPDKNEVPESTDGDAILDRRRSIPNLLLDVSHLKRLFLSSSRNRLLQTFPKPARRR